MVRAEESAHRAWGKKERPGIVIEALWLSGVVEGTGDRSGSSEKGKA